MVTMRTIESLLVLSSIEVAGTNLYRTAVINSASGKIVAAARECARDLITYDDVPAPTRSWNPRLKSYKTLKRHKNFRNFRNCNK